MRSWILLFALIMLIACADMSRPVETITTSTVPTVALESPTAVALAATSTISITPVVATAVPPSTSTPLSTFVPVKAGTSVPPLTEIINGENANHVVQIAQWGRGYIQDIAYSDDGRWLLVGTSSGVYMHYSENLKREPLFLQTEAAAKAVALSPDNQYLAIALANGRVQFWHLPPKQLLWQKEMKVNGFVFAPDGQQLLVTEIASNHNNILFLRPLDGTELHRFSNMTDVKFSPQGNTFVVWNQTTASVYRWPDMEYQSQTEAILFPEPLTKHYEELFTNIQNVQFVENDEIILLNFPFSLNVTGDVQLQRASDNSLLISLPPLPNSTYPVPEACDLEYYFADPPEPPFLKQSEWLWEQQIMALMYREPGYYGDSRHHSEVRFHRLGQEVPLYSLQEGIIDFAFSPDGKSWASGLQNGRLQIRRIEDGQLLQTFDEYQSVVLGITVSADNEFVMVQYVDELRLYLARNGRLYRRYPAQQSALSADGTTIALGHADGRIELYNLTDNTLLNTLVAHTDAISALAFSPIDNTLYSAATDCQINIWQIQDGRLIGSLENYTISSPFSDEEKQFPLRIWQLAISSDGKRLIGRSQSQMHLWDLTQTAKQDDFYSEYNGNSTTNMAFAPQNNYVVVPSSGVKQITANGELTDIWSASNMQSIAFSPDEQWALLAFYDNHLEWRSASNGEMAYQWPAGQQKVTHLAFAPNGRFFIFTATDNNIYLWGIP